MELAESLPMTCREPHSPPHATWIDYVFTYSTTVGLVLTAMLTYRLAALTFGELGLSQYAVLRRIIAFVQPLLALGISVALSRQIAAHRYLSRSGSDTSYLLAALVMVLIATTGFLLPVVLFPNLAAYVFFGSAEYDQHALAMGPMLIGMGLQTVCYAHFHGLFQMRTANCIRLMNIGLIPLIVMKCSSSIPAAICWTGVAMSLISLAAILPHLRNFEGGIQGVLPAMRELTRLGPARVPGDLAFAALMALPAVIVAHSSGVKAGGLIAFCVTLLMLAQTTSTPISTLLLPQATAMLRNGDLLQLRWVVVKVVAAGIGITAGGIIVFWSATDFILSLCVGEFAAELPRLAQIIILGALPLNLYTCLRSVIDAGRDRAVNARNSCLSLVSFFAILPIAQQFGDDLHAAPFAFIAAISILALLTAWDVWQLMGPNSTWATPTVLPLHREAA